MNKQDSWNSEFKKKRFYEKQALKKEKKQMNFLQSSILNIPKTISVMLDLDGTCDFINDERAKKFIQQLEVLRKKFKAEFATISISTHYHNSNKIKQVLDIISPNLLNTIKISTSFYLGGTYDYDKKEENIIGNFFNSNKVKTFEEFFIHNLAYNNQWFALIDDNISDDVYKKYQYNHPMLVGKPSRYTKEISKNNFMQIATTTESFDGVIEILDKYIESIKSLTLEQILENQKTMICHLSSCDLTEKIIYKDYTFLERYFKEGYADEDDYTDVLDWLQREIKYFKENFSKEELKHIYKLIRLIISQQNGIRNKEEKKKILKPKETSETLDE